MADKRIGVVVAESNSNAALSTIENLEQRGITAAWMTSGSAGGADSLSVLTVAATRTQNIMLGTAITQTFPRHPIALALAWSSPWELLTVRLWPTCGSTCE